MVAIGKRKVREAVKKVLEKCNLPNDEKKSTELIYRRYNDMAKRNKKGDITDTWKIHDFIEWFLKAEKCSYCGCELNTLQKFYGITKKQNKRPTRGNSLEVDRKKDKPYSADNCCLACYWCNNAKTDVFTHEEFKPIGKAIGNVIRERISGNQGR